MRLTSLAAVALAAFALGCGGGSARAIDAAPGDGPPLVDAGTDGPAEDAPPTSDGGSDGGGGACADLLPDDPCGACMTASCCDQVRDCGGQWNCTACLTGFDSAHACTQDPQLAALMSCVQTSCAAQCLTATATARATCDAPVVAPSGGACLAPGGAVHCNPVTNEGCNTEAGEACDVSLEGFECYPAPGMLEVCSACGAGAGCGAGLMCLSGDSANVADRCARWCCDDGDCGSGRCDRSFVPQGGGAIGVCVGGTYIDDTLAPTTNCHSPPLDHEACEACCDSTYPAGRDTYHATAQACACNGDCATPCAAWCASGDEADLTSACEVCVSVGFTTGRCARDACTADPACADYLRCKLTDCGH